MKYSPIIAAMLLCAYLGLHNGYLALYENKSDDPVKVFPYRAALYPKIDQAALEEGIPIHSPAQLQQRLEDFLS